jgi:hypothetical protein
LPGNSNGKQVSTATNKHTTIEKFLEAVFLCSLCRGYIARTRSGYIHLTKVKQSLFTRDKPNLSSEMMLYKDYGRKDSVAKKKSLVMNLEGFDAKMY